MIRSTSSTGAKETTVAGAVQESVSIADSILDTANAVRTVVTGKAAEIGLTANTVAVVVLRAERFNVLDALHGVQPS